VALLPVPTMDPAMLPARLGPWMEDIADRGCFPLEYPAVAGINALSGVFGRRALVRPKRHDDWLVAVNLWGGAVGPPGLQKSPAVQEAHRPLQRLVADAMEAHKRALEAYEHDLLVDQAQAEAAKGELKQAAKAKKPTEVLRRLAAAVAGVEKREEPKLKRYLVNDATVEKLGVLLAENPHGLVVFRDELTGFLRLLDRPGHENDRGFYLEAWNGTQSYVYDRIERGTIVIPHTCLALFGTIQPGPLARYLKGSAGGDEADGFMPRFQLLVYPDPRPFENVDRYPDAAAKAAAYEVFKALDAFEPRARGCAYDEDRQVAYLGFAPSAQDLFDQWRCDLENRLRGGGETTLMEIHLSKYRSLMPSLAMLFHLVERVDAPNVGPITVEAAGRAAAWCDFLEAHARRIYQAALDGDPEAAQQLGERIKQSLPNPFTYRQVAKKGWSGLGDAEDVKRAVDILEDRGWVKVVEKPPGPQGGRPTELVYIHPRLRDGDAEAAAADGGGEGP
jgi:putative DNA primase/helicase